MGSIGTNVGEVQAEAGLRRGNPKNGAQLIDRRAVLFAAIHVYEGKRAPPKVRNRAWIVDHVGVNHDGAHPVRQPGEEIDESLLLPLGEGLCGCMYGDVAEVGHAGAQRIEQGGQLGCRQRGDLNRIA